MESRSQISSRSSNHYEQNKIPAINIQQYILDEHAKNLSQISSTSRIKKGKYPQIFTVAQTLKDPLILNHIRPDYGSLAEFVGHINIGRDLLNQKKRKNDTSQEETQQKKIKYIFRQKTKQQLNAIFLDKSSSALQKKVVGKMLVENLFKESFGMSLNAFQNQNISNPPPKNYKIDLANIDQIFNGKRPQSRKTQQTNDKKLMKVGENSKKDQQFLRLKNNQSKTSTNRQKIQILEQIKSKYISLKKIEFEKQCEEFSKFKAPKSQQQVKNLNQKYPEEKSSRQKPNYVFEVSVSCIILEKLTLKPQLVFHILSEIQIQAIQEITLNQVRISQELLCFMLQGIKNICPKLNKLVLRCISVQKNQNLAVKIKQILQALSLKQLVLQYLDFETKQFCQICLGIGSNTTLQFFSFDNNSIDQRVCKSLQLISKHCSNLKKITLKKNYLQPHHFSYFTPEAKAKIII